MRTSVQHQGPNGLDDRGALVAYISGGRVLEAGLFQSACTKDLTQLIEPDFFANVKLDEDEDGAAQRRLNRDLNPAVGLRWVKKNFGI
jgi:hypothetical protein